MITLFSIMLLVIGILNILIMRNQRDRLSIFKKVDTAPDFSFIQQISQRRKDTSETTFFERMLLVFVDFYLILFKTASRSQRLKSLGLLLVGLTAVIWLNEKYIQLPNKIVTPLAFLLLVIILFIQAKKRLKIEFEEVFPEVLNILVGVVSSGNSVAKGVSECSLQIDGVVAKVFREISLRLEIGEESDKVLFDSYRYLPFREYYFFILTVIVNIQGGGEIKEILYRLSKMLVSNRALERTLYSKTAEVRTTMKILICMPFAFIFLLNFIAPENVEFLLHDSTGNLVLYYVFGSVAIGWLIIRRMINKII